MMIGGGEYFKRPPRSTEYSMMELDRKEGYSFAVARRRALIDFTKIVLAPAAAFTVLVRATGVQLGHYAVPSCGLWIFLVWYLPQLYNSVKFRRDAKRLATERGVPLGTVPV